MSGLAGPGLYLKLTVRPENVKGEGAGQILSTVNRISLYPQQAGRLLNYLKNLGYKNMAGHSPVFKWRGSQLTRSVTSFVDRVIQMCVLNYGENNRDKYIIMEKVGYRKEGGMEKGRTEGKDGKTEERKEGNDGKKEPCLGSDLI